MFTELVLHDILKQSRITSGSCAMQSLDPRWLTIELESIENDENGWDTVFKESYTLAVQRVIEYQARFARDMVSQEAA